MNTFLKAVAASAISAGFLSGVANAQDKWPTRTITYVVPFPAGSNTDVLGRIIADELGKRLKVSVVIENRPGATGMIGSTHVAKAKPDGYTIMGGSIASHAINAGLFPNMQYDPVGDFAPITVIGFNANTLVVSNTSPFTDVKGIIAAARAKPDTISYASSGIGTTQHLSGVLFGQQANVKVVHVPYGGKAALPDVMGGQVNMMFEGPTVIPHVQQKTVRALAVTSRTRLASLPDVPTMQELGLPEYEMRAWQAIFAPKGTPKPIIEKLYSEIKAILDTPQVREKLDTMGVEPSGMPPDEFAAFQKQEVEKWRTVIRNANIKIQ